MNIEEHYEGTETSIRNGAKILLLLQNMTIKKEMKLGKSVAGICS